MRLAIHEAKRGAQMCEAPVGALITLQGEVLAATCNLVETRRNPLAHAEMLAIEATSKKLGNHRLDGCELYCTLEPCPMCAGAMIHARIKRLVFGAYDPKWGAFNSKLSLFEPGLFNHNIEVIPGLLQDECSELMSAFFRRLRTGR